MQRRQNLNIVIQFRPSMPPKTLPTLEGFRSSELEERPRVQARR